MTNPTIFYVTFSLLLSLTRTSLCHGTITSGFLADHGETDVLEFDSRGNDEVLTEGSLSFGSEAEQKKKKISLDEILDFYEEGTLGSVSLEKEKGSLNTEGAPLIAYVPPKFNAIFTDNMVLQRDDNVSVYGVSSPGMTITVTFGTIQTKTTIADTIGRWHIFLDRMTASYTAQVLSVTDGVETVTLSNVLVGDVWLCSGQSNMDRPFWNFHSLDPTGKDNPFVRLVQVKKGGPKTPTDTLSLTSELDGSWQECTSKYLIHFSPGAYFFGAEMESTNHVPMGLMHVAKGATAIEEWMAAEALKKVGVDPEEQDIFTRNYNGMIYPLRNFTFKGILWYQGETNSHVPVKYQQRFPVMIQKWRDLFGRGDIPFYFAQLSSHGASDWDVTDTAWGFQREAQQKALALPNTRMIVLTDVGEYLSVHPENKVAVGERFARHALAADGHTSVNTDSPTFSSMQINEDKVVITFDRVGGGLETREIKMNYNQHLTQGEDPDAFVVPANELWGFSVCGPNKVFVDASATITSANQVTVWSEYIKNPIAVRYCFKWFGLCNLYASNDGWVATPFRTDNFPVPLTFRGECSGELFIGNFDALGDPMEISTSSGPSNIYPVSIDSVEGYQAFAYNSTVRQMYYATKNPAFQNGREPYVIVKFLYYDKGAITDEILFHYDHIDGSAKRGPLRIKIRNTLTWRVATVVLRDARFNQRYMHSDLRVQSETNDMIFGGVYLSGAPRE